MRGNYCQNEKCNYATALGHFQDYSNMLYYVLFCYYCHPAILLPLGITTAILQQGHLAVQSA